VAELEKANSLLSKRPRAEEKRTANVGGSLISLESKELIAQQDIEVELRMKRRQARAQ
jgi:hypothetical protein